MELSPRIGILGDDTRLSGGIRWLRSARRAATSASVQLRQDPNAGFILDRGFLFRRRVWFVGTCCPPVSANRKVAGGISSGNRRRPDPSTSGWSCSTYSSMRSRRISDWTSTPLPNTTRLSSCRSLSAATASAVERLGEGVGLVLGPEVRETLVRGPSEQQGPGRSHACSYHVQHGPI